MEQYLLDKMKAGNTDMIDKMMIGARVHNGLSTTEKVMSEIIDKIGEVVNEYNTELKLAGFSVLFLVSDKIIAKGDISAKAVFGNPDTLKELAVRAIEED